MAESPVLRVEQDGFRNCVIRFSMVSDGTGLSSYKVFDATSSGGHGVNIGGQLFYPGVHTTLIGMDFDVDGMRAELLWDASSPEQIIAFGASPEQFDWRDIGGIRVPAGLTGATGSILVSTIAPAANATLALVLYIRKNLQP